MKTKILTLALSLVCLTCFGQELELPRAKGNSLALGYCLNQSGKDFGIGFSLTSPFIKNRFAFKGSETYQWHEYYNGDATIWQPYHNVKIGIVTTGAIISDQIRIYGEGGTSIIFLDKKLSDSPISVGGYGSFGFEFFMDKIDRSCMSYYIELGGIGTGAVAEKVNTKPILSNGFLINTGFKIYL